MWCGVFLQCSKIDGDCLQFENPRISPVEFLLDTACWSKKKDAGLLTGKAKRIFIFYDNVTFFGTNKNCCNRSHLPEFFIKAPHFLLAWLLCFVTEQPSSTFFSEAMFTTPPIVLAGTIHTLPGKMRVEQCPFSFLYDGILPGSLSFGHVRGDFQFSECIKNSVEQAKKLT